MTQTTQAKTPPMKSSKELTQVQLKFARQQGDALGKTLDYMMNQEAHGDEIAAGEYRIGYAVENAEGMWVMRDGKLTWQNPQQENAHIEVSVRDGADGRFVPALNVTATLIGADGKEVGTHQQPFLWHPWLYHYGRNWTLPRDGQYTLRIHIDPPTFSRHDKENGNRFAQPVEVEFQHVTIKTGQKLN